MTKHHLRRKTKQNNGLQPKSDVLRPKSDGLHPVSDVLASNLLAMASNLLPMASNLLAMASNLIAIASIAKLFTHLLGGVQESCMTATSRILATKRSLWAAATH